MNNIVIIAELKKIIKILLRHELSLLEENNFGDMHQYLDLLKLLTNNAYHLHSKNTATKKEDNEV